MVSDFGTDPFINNYKKINSVLQLKFIKFCDTVPPEVEYTYK